MSSDQLMLEHVLHEIIFTCKYCNASVHTQITRKTWKMFYLNSHLNNADADTDDDDDDFEAKAETIRKSRKIKSIDRCLNGRKKLLLMVVYYRQPTFISSLTPTPLYSTNSYKWYLQHKYCSRQASMIMICMNHRQSI